MPISDGLGPHIVGQKMEKIGSFREDLDGKKNPTRVGTFVFAVNMVKIIDPICISVE